MGSGKPKQRLGKTAEGLSSSLEPRPPLPGDIFPASERSSAMKRYLVQHQMMHANHSRWADSIEEARVAAELVWGPHCVDVRQEISDGETGERWVRAGGALGWQHAPGILAES
jgi:hypothetical protein